MSRLAPLVALLTDFGSKDHYVGTIKAAMLSSNPAIQFIDISHEVAPQHTQEAGYLLWASYNYFPAGTIFVCAVDPGVGTMRKIIVARTKKYFFLAPDNGLLDFVLSEEEHAEAREVVINKNLLGEKKSGGISTTFHGRDVFAPAAALLSKGKDWKTISQRIHLRPPKRKIYDSRHRSVRPAILHIDTFGNIITNIYGRCISGITIGRSRVDAWVSNYQSAPSNKPYLIVGSSGLVEVVTKNASAARLLSASVDSSIRVSIK